MTDEQETLLMLKGAISELDSKTRADIEAAISDIKGLRSLYGVTAVDMAIALMGAEMAAA